MKNLFKKTAIFLMAAIMLMSMCVPAFAYEYTQPLDTTNATTTINIHTIMNEYADFDWAIFNFQIELGHGYYSGDMKPGIDVSNVKIYDNYGFYEKAMTDRDVLTKTYADVSGYPELSGKIEEGQKFVTFPITIDFSEVNFTEPGVYRYELSPTISGKYANYIMQDGLYDFGATSFFYIDVYVENNDNLDGLKIVDIIVCRDVLPGEGGSVDYYDNQVVKINNIIFKYGTVNLDLTKILAGNQANMNAKCNFNIEFENASEYHLYLDQITTTGDVRYEDRGYYIFVELGHNDKITFHALPIGTVVTIIEENDDYFTSYTVNGDGSDGTALSHYTITKDTSVVFTNEKTGVIPTGVFFSNGPMLMLAVVAFFGCIGMMYMRKHRKGEE